MKKKTLVATLLSSALVVGTLVGVAVSKRKIAFSRTHADNYTLYAFDAYCDNPGSSVAMTTSLGNQIVLSTSGASVSGNKIALAPGGYLEVARDGTKENLNAIDGLTSIETDFEGRIAYSYRDQVATYDDAVNGNYTFSADYPPSFFKLYNDSSETKEINTLAIKYNCMPSTSSVLKGYKTHSVEDGVVTSLENNITISLLEQTEKGIISYSVKNNDSSVEKGYLGAVVGLATDKTAWYGNGAQFVWGVLGGQGSATLATVENSATAVNLFEKDKLSRHPVSNYVSGTYTNFTLKFDVDNQYYALYHENQIMAVDTTTIATGAKVGFRISNLGDSVKDIVLQKNIDFEKEPLQIRRWNNINVYNDGTSNVYETDPNSAAAWHYFQQELPDTGTIQFDFASVGGASNWVEGLVFSSSLDVTSITGGKAALFGVSGTYQNFTAASCYDKGDGTFDTAWMKTRNGKFSYAFDGSVVHCKMSYNLTNSSWEMFTRATLNDEWVKTGDFIENEKDISGLKYLGFRYADTHKTDPYYTRFFNLIVNGVKY